MVGVNSINYGISNNYVNFKSNSGITNSQNQNYGLNNLKNSSFSNIAVSGDTFVSSNKTQKEEKNNNKLLLGAAAAVGIGALAFVLTRGRVNGASTEQVVKQFTSAKSVEEAQKFANKTLNVEYIHAEKANLDVMNTVNEWLYREKILNNNKVPDIVNFMESNIENPLNLTDKIVHQGKTYNALGVNVAYINKFDDLIKLAFENEGLNLGMLIQKNDKNLYEVISQESNCENLEKFVQKLNSYNSNSTYKEKMEIYDGTSEALSYLNNLLKGKKVKMNEFSSDGSFIHELGHLLHQDSYKLYREAATEGSAVYSEFRSPEIQKIAEQISDYACSNPLEYVAETYKKLRRGANISDEAQALYQKYKGPSISR